MNENYEPCFYNVSDDWQERWSLIREFTTRWHGIKFRNREELLPLVKQEEANLGFELPPSVREYIMFSLDTKQQGFYNILRDDYKIQKLKDLSAISLMRLSEGDVFWGIEQKNLSKEDPSVNCYVIKNYLNYQNFDNYLFSNTIKEEGFRLAFEESSSITSFILQHILSFLYGEGGGFSVTVDNIYELSKAMDKCFINKSIFDNMFIYENQNIICIILDRKDNTCKLIVELWKPILKNKIPQIILKYINNGGSFHGIFTKLRFHNK